MRAAGPASPKVELLDVGGFAEDAERMDEHEEHLAAAQHVVDIRHAELDERLSVAPAHTVGGVPTSPLSGLQPQEQALYEARVILDATMAEDHSAAATVPVAAKIGHDGYPDAATAVASGDLDPYCHRGAVVTRGTDNVLIEVDGKILAMVRIPHESTETAERATLEAYLAISPKG
jgi:hypothetical protein